MLVGIERRKKHEIFDTRKSVFSFNNIDNVRCIKILFFHLVQLFKSYKIVIVWIRISRTSIVPQAIKACQLGVPSTRTDSLRAPKLEEQVDLLETAMFLSILHKILFQMSYSMMHRSYLSRQWKNKARFFWFSLFRKTGSSSLKHFSDSHTRKITWFCSTFSGLQHGQP